MQVIDTTGTIELAAGTTTTVVITVRNHETAKILRVASSNVVLLTGPMFQPDNVHFAVTLGAGCTQNQFTYVNGELDFNLSPLAVGGNERWTITAQNPGAANCYIQFWLLT